MSYKRVVSVITVLVVVSSLLTGKDFATRTLAATTFYLPWSGGQEWQTTRDNCGGANSHGCTQPNTYAWDFVPVPNKGTDEVVAVADGTVCYVQESVPDDAVFTSGHAGNTVVIAHDGTCNQRQNGVYSFYAHLKNNSVMVNAGDSITRGSVIARIGNSGYSFGAHLHLSINSQYWVYSQYGYETASVISLSSQFSDASLRADGGRPVAGKSYVSDNYGQPPIPTVPADTNLVQNGDFSTGTNGWWRYGDASWAIYNNVLNFKREAGGTGGSVGQNMNYTVPPNSAFEIRLDLGNNSSVQKQPGVILRSQKTWENAIRCTFNIPPKTPLRTYIIRGRTDSTVWDGLKLEVWPDPPDSIPDVQMDNVSITYQPNLPLSATECIEPVAQSKNLVQNGDFSTGTNGWWRYGDASWAIYNNVLNFKREAGGTGGSVGQNMNYTVPPNSAFEIRLDLGNASQVTKSPGVFLRSRTNFDGAIECHFTLPPNTPLRTFVVKGGTGSIAWSGISFEVWPDPPDSIPDVQMDNVSVIYRPDLNPSRTECIAPTVFAAKYKIYIPIASR